jgi:nodulation protein F
LDRELKETSMANDIETSTIALIASAGETDPDKITLETELAELEIDSLALTEIVMEIEDQHDIEIDLNTAEAWESLKTVGDMIDMVKKLIAAQN